MNHYWADRHWGASFALALAVAVGAAACSNQTSPISPSGESDVLSDLAVATGNCPGGTGTKDESAPFSLSGNVSVVVKAGTQCYGPTAPGGTIFVGTTACFVVTYNAGTNTTIVSNHPDHVGRICKGISHIELAENQEPPEEICKDGIDNDGDGQVDEDCEEPPVEDCKDGIDNDGDGKVDEEDEDCKV